MHFYQTNAEFENYASAQSNQRTYRTNGMAICPSSAFAMKPRRWRDRRGCYLHGGAAVPWWCAVGQSFKFCGVSG